MKKNLNILIIFVISLVLFSCKSSKEAVEVEGEVNSAVEVEEVVTDEDNDKKSDKKKSNDENLSEENTKDVEEKGFIGWIDVAQKDPVHEDGIVQLKVDSNLGTFCIYAINEEEKAFNVLSTLNEFSSTGFFLKAGKKIYPLIGGKNIYTTSGELINGVSIFYDVKNVANVLLKMTTFPSLADHPADTIKVTVDVTNKGKKIDTFALKSILDTVLGEGASLYHFYTPDEMPVKKEIYSRSMYENQWFVSKNGYASMQIILNGGDITPPEFVALANYGTLKNAEWEPNMLSQRAFDTVLSYNNSAICTIWPKVRLEPEQTTRVTFYISLALYGKTPTGHYYINGIAPPEKKTEMPVINSVPKIAEKTVVENIKTEPEVIEDDSFENVEFNVKKIPKDHLTVEYIQSLTNRINELEKSENPNRNEIIYLGKELDAILSILKPE